MKIGVFAYPTMVQDPGGGMVTLTKTYEYLKKTGHDVERFDPWVHRLKDFDLIHHFGLGYGNYDWFQTVKDEGKKLALTTMYWLPNRPRSQRLSRKWLSRIPFVKPPPALIRLMLQLADLVLPNAEGEKQLLADLYGCDTKKMAIVPCGVDNRFVGASPKPFVERYEIDNYLLCIGRFDPRQKNQLGLIRALKDTDLPVVFVGSPITGAEAYLEQCRKEASPKTLFIDYLKPEEGLLASAFAAANTLVVPSFYEYPCMVAMEALLAGTKVAITTGGTTQETFKNYVTYLNPYSIKDMKEAIVHAYETDLPEGAEQYARDTFLWDNVGRRLEEAYRGAGFIE
ncbi:MAG: glycosyltransferase family 4 protein [bacterium]|nr:glycosyltransferase family 4 protein [bacterium]